MNIFVKCKFTWLGRCRKNNISEKYVQIFELIRLQVFVKLYPRKVTS
jgi:hypothetical protein